MMTESGPTSPTRLPRCLYWVLRDRRPVLHQPVEMQLDMHRFCTGIGDCDCLVEGDSRVLSVKLEQEGTLGATAQRGDENREGEI
jgi:hypothetical protein